MLTPSKRFQFFTLGQKTGDSHKTFLAVDHIIG